MDSLSHPLTALALSAVAGAPHTPGRRRALVLASLLPDADYVIWKLDGPVTYFLHHRRLSHSLLLAPVIALVAAGVASLTAKKSRFVDLLAPAALGVISHLALDMLTAFPTRALAPFSGAGVYGDTLFLFDVAWILFMLFTLLYARFRGPGGARLAFTLPVAYLALAAWQHSVALHTLELATPSAIRRAALPAPFTPFTWLGLSLDAEGITQWELATIAPAARVINRFPLPPPSPPLEKALSDPRVQDLAANSRFVALRDCGGEIAVIDLAFSNPLILHALTGPARAITPHSLAEKTQTVQVRVAPDGTLTLKREKLAGPCLGDLPDPMTGLPPSGR